MSSHDYQENVCFIAIFVLIFNRALYFWNIIANYYEPAHLITVLIAHLNDIPMFYIKYLTMHKVHMHADAIRLVLYGCAYVQEIIHSLKLVDYPPHTYAQAIHQI